jgi:hypothetical protein
MSKPEILPDNPLENIAQLVRKQFREQSMRDMAAAASKGKRKIPLEAEIPDRPTCGQ